ncbi:hypothetical protein DAEQUDRAFT_770374 [Daedalea quercina L-15889]|uniref:Uncharacterized protein n=1 Tax=Daedalea quercina L-15889 TaxID=1314783 RepID=A0A165KWY4_9APHY|nr:hypothetical protein DAEQUDRAFT_770374 [Daedalea quercina L-15889]
MKFASVFLVVVCAAIPTLASPIVVRATDAEFLAPHRRAASPTDAEFLGPGRRSPRPTDAEFLGVTPPVRRAVRPTDAEFLAAAVTGVAVQ